MEPSRAVLGSGKVSPRELFLGRVVDASKELKLGFGEYVQVHEDNSITNTMEARTQGAISLGPCGNVQGGYRFLNLTTWKPVTRRSWTKVPMPSYVVDLLTAKALDEAKAKRITLMPDGTPRSEDGIQVDDDAALSSLENIEENEHREAAASSSPPSIIDLNADNNNMDVSGRIEGVDEVRDNEEVTPHLEHVVDADDAMQPLPREEEGIEEEVAANQRDIDTAVNHHPSSIQSAAAPAAVVNPPIVTPMDGGDGAGDVAI
eukprot:gene12398-14170_t